MPKPKEKVLFVPILTPISTNSQDALTLRLEQEAKEEEEAKDLEKVSSEIPHIYKPPFWSGKPKYHTPPYFVLNEPIR